MEYHYIIADMRVESIPDPEQAELWLRSTADSLGFDIRSVSKATFEAPVSGHAYTLAAILSGSHAVIHTAPEDSWVEVVFALCRPVKMEDLLAKIKDYFKPIKTKVNLFIGEAP